MILTIVNQKYLSEIPMIVEINGPNGLMYKNSIPVNRNGDGLYNEIISMNGKEWLKDLGSGYEIAVDYGGRIFKERFHSASFGANVILDRETYSCTDRIYVLVIAPNFNRSYDQADSIFVTISTAKGKLVNYRLKETDPDTSIFTGEILLTGYVGMKNPGSKVGVTTGTDPTNGLIEALGSDRITVSLQYSEHEVVVGSADIVEQNLVT